VVAFGFLFHLYLSFPKGVWLSVLLNVVNPFVSVFTDFHQRRFSPKFIKNAVVSFTVCSLVFYGPSAELPFGIVDPGSVVR
jgi:hypothetical protein